MTSEQFCYWLQGYFEITESARVKPIELSSLEVGVIRDHLNEVFRKVTPKYPGLHTAPGIRGQDIINVPYYPPQTIGPAKMPYQTNQPICSSGTANAIGTTSSTTLSGSGLGSISMGGGAC